VSNFVVQCLRHQPITVFGNGTQTRSFCYVDDLIDGFVRLMASSVEEPVNLGNPQELSMIDLAQQVKAMIGSTSTISHDPLPTDDPTRRCPDISRAKERLGWAPTVPLDVGLSKTIADFRERLGQGSSAPG
jgi:UDP-glucuronate decarboxylase